MKHLRNSLILILTLTSFAACKQGAKDADKILDAQNCLNGASPGQADDCVAKVDGIESEAAYLIRCVGEFVDEGYGNSSKIATAIDNLKNQGEGSAGSTAMIASLAFTAVAGDEAANAANAKKAFGYCTTAKSKGLIFLSGLAQTSTVLASLSGSIDLSNPASLTGANLQAAMTALAGNPEAQAAVGTAIVSIYETNCVNGTTTGSFCEQFSSVVSNVNGGTSNPAGIGQQIMTCYTNNSTPGCTGF